MKLVSAVLVMAALTTGCAVNRATATVDPQAKLDTLQSFHVQHFEKDERGTDKLIAENLRVRGYQVSTGKDVPPKVDAVVTYVDKWFWDITMYMLELTINFREPNTNFPLATGNSYHTSLSRKAAPEMVDEVVGNILKEGKGKK
jgi:hypothetical protein